ncbi:uncharacterized protein LOC116132713 [Pistacia vera]|uniref:uncharacterized protein LOC116132713 n=1 Tax=Pistacia vera TaxID=55513 RepID=UPI001262E0AB|nr:uncharacterized protein LOC116132713 [Pistacia vera]
MQKTAQAWFIRGPSTANSNDHRQKPLSLLADWNSYTFSQESDSSAFDLEAAVRTTTDKVSGTFSICAEFERLEWILLFGCPAVANLNGGGADEKLEDSGKSTSEIDLRVALGSGCVQWRRNHQLNSCLEDKVYVAFHDESWGVPVYDDNPLFELLALCGMLMDYNWIEILKRKELFREAFAGFDPVVVAKMGEKEILEILSDKAIMLAESRVRCILDNANCIMKIVNEFQSFSSFMWGYVNYKPVINKYRYPRNVPLRTPKAEAISKDLLKEGFQFVGPVIVYSFMQAAKLTINWYSLTLFNLFIGLLYMANCCDW